MVLPVLVMWFVSPSYFADIVTDDAAPCGV